MGALLSYSILSGLLLLAMYLPYRAFLARENQHAYNRAVLLAIYVVAFAALPTMRLVERLTTVAVEPNVTLIYNAVVTDAAPVSEPIWGTILIWIYIGGMLVVGIHTLITWTRLAWTVCRGERIRHGNYTLVLTDREGVAPFSWMRFIVMSRKDYAESGQEIIDHERAHIANCHWIDLLVAQAACVVNWFNPAAWMMRSSLMLVHEYQADNAVLDAGHNTQIYQLLLIKKAAGSRFPSLANSLNHSKLKKRITMMYQKKSGVGRKFRALTLVPMFALALGITAVPSVRAAISTISSSATTVSKVSEKTANGEISADNFKISQISYDAGVTTFVVVGQNLGNNLSVSGCKYTVENQTVQPKSMQCTLTDGTAVISANFSDVPKGKAKSLTFNANGTDIVIDLSDALSMTPIEIVGYGVQRRTDTPSASATLSATVADDLTIYLDGKEITEGELNAIPTSNIESIEVDKQRGVIAVTLKK